MKLAFKESSVLAVLTAYLEMMMKRGRLSYSRHHPVRPVTRKTSFFGMTDNRLIFAKIPESQKGAPDLMVYLPGGRTVFVEVKSDCGAQSPDQKQWQRRHEKLGFKYILVRKLEDLTEVINPIL